MSSNSDPVAFGTQRTVLVSVCIVVIVALVALSVYAGELSWGPGLSIVGAAFTAFGLYSGWRKERDGTRRDRGREI